RSDGVTVILTTHYIEEAEAMADRIGVIDHGRLILVEEKEALMRKLGRKELRVELERRLTRLPASLARPGLALAADGAELVYDYDARSGGAGVAQLFADLRE